MLKVTKRYAIRVGDVKWTRMESHWESSNNELITTAHSVALVDCLVDLAGADYEVVVETDRYTFTTRANGDVFYHDKVGGLRGTTDPMVCYLLREIKEKWTSS